MNDISFMKKVTFVALFFLAVLCQPVFVFSQDSESVSPSVNTASEINHKKEFLDKLKQLKETDPDAFRELVGQHFQNQKQHFKQLREENPEEYQQRIERKKANLSQRMKWMEENKPQEFQRLKQRVTQNKDSRFLEEKKPWVKRWKAQNFQRQNPVVAPSSTTGAEIHKSQHGPWKGPRGSRLRPTHEGPQRP
jgi:exonuclease VII large subunit